MDVLTQINKLKNQGKKYKQIVELISKKAKKDKGLIKDLVAGLKTGSEVKKGTCAEILEYITQEKPELVIKYVSQIAKYLNFDAPRVKWETCRIMGNLASKYHDQITRYVDKILINSKDEGTVVRWSAAFALTEIAKADNKKRDWVEKIKKIIRKEKNSGVKNVYVKALKEIEKEEGGD